MNFSRFCAYHEFVYQLVTPNNYENPGCLQQDIVPLYINSFTLKVRLDKISADDVWHLRGSEAFENLRFTLVCVQQQKRDIYVSVFLTAWLINQTSEH